MIHTKKDAELCLLYFQKHIWKDAQLIGSFSKGAETSIKDIDIYLPGYYEQKLICNDNQKMKYRIEMAALIGSEDVEITDWGGWFFHRTIFGNVDVFFDISEFDY